MNLYKYHSTPGSLRKYDENLANGTETLEHALHTNKPIPASALKLIAKNPKAAFLYAQAKRHRWPPGEDAIVTDGIESYNYAYYVIRGRWPKGEDTIAKNPKAAYLYASDIIKGRWPKGEDAIATDFTSTVWYFRFVLDDEFIKGEKIIAAEGTVNAIWEYVANFKKKPFPEGEHKIATNGPISYKYATRILHTRFPEGEQAILDNAFRGKGMETAWKYLFEVIRGPWPALKQQFVKNNQLLALEKYDDFLKNTNDY